MSLDRRLVKLEAARGKGDESEAIRAAQDFVLAALARKHGGKDGA